MTVPRQRTNRAPIEVSFDAEGRLYEIWYLDEKHRRIQRVEDGTYDGLSTMVDPYSGDTYSRLEKSDKGSWMWTEVEIVRVYRALKIRGTQ